MACPTCDHTMQNLGLNSELIKIFWCPRCGTLREQQTGYEKISPPYDIGYAINEMKKKIHQQLKTQLKELIKDYE